MTSSNRPGGSRNKLAAQTGAEALAFTYPTSLTLLSTQTPQTKSYYCGPASGNALVKSWKAQFAHTTASAVDGASLSQTKMATSTYMNTDSKGSTDWIANDFPDGVNTWLGVSFYAQMVGTSAADISSHVQYDIYSYYMLGSDMHENAGGAHYNHHPVAKAISHWTTIYGYSSSGATLKFQDPAANTASGVLGSDWGSVNPYFTLSSSDAYFYMDQNGLSRGIVW